MRQSGQIYKNDKGLWKLKGTGFTVIQNDIIAKLGPAAITGASSSGAANAFGDLISDTMTSVAMKTVMRARAAADTVINGQADKNHYKATQDIFTTFHFNDSSIFTFE